MFFNSYSFIFIFLLLVVTVYFVICKCLSVKWTRLFLFVSSLGFMSLWNIYFAAVL